MYRKNNFVKCDLSKKYKLYFSYPITTPILISKVGQIVNLMPVSWQMPLSYNPPLIGVLISSDRNTFNSLIHSKNFTLNYLDITKIDLIKNLGTTSSSNINKLKKFNVKIVESEQINSPKLKDSYVSFECKIVQMKKIGDHYLFISKILSIWCKKKSFYKDGTLNIKRIKPALYLGNLIFKTVFEGGD
jgi:flavin reductase (DIM6/NTAB) family NADH-FMN oxidoreductase RutF